MLSCQAALRRVALQPRLKKRVRRPVLCAEMQPQAEYAGLAHSVERITRNDEVAGSIPASSSRKNPVISIITGFLIFKALSKCQVKCHSRHMPAAAACKLRLRRPGRDNYCPGLSGNGAFGAVPAGVSRKHKLTRRVFLRRYIHIDIVVIAVPISKLCSCAGRTKYV